MGRKQSKKVSKLYSNQTEMSKHTIYYIQCTFPIIFSFLSFMDVLALEATNKLFRSYIRKECECHKIQGKSFKYLHGWKNIHHLELKELPYSQTGALRLHLYPPESPVTSTIPGDFLHAYSLFDGNSPTPKTWRDVRNSWNAKHFRIYRFHEKLTHAWNSAKFLRSLTLTCQRKTTIEVWILMLHRLVALAKETPTYFRQLTHIRLHLLIEELPSANLSHATQSFVCQFSYFQLIADFLALFSETLTYLEVHVHVPTSLCKTSTIVVADDKKPFLGPLRKLEYLSITGNIAKFQPSTFQPHSDAVYFRQRPTVLKTLIIDTASLNHRIYYPTKTCTVLLNTFSYAPNIFEDAEPDNTPWNFWETDGNTVPVLQYDGVLHTGLETLQTQVTYLNDCLAYHTKAPKLFQAMPNLRFLRFPLNTSMSVTVDFFFALSNVLLSYIRAYLACVKPYFPPLDQDQYNPLYDQRTITFDFLFNKEPLQNFSRNEIVGKIIWTQRNLESIFSRTLVSLQRGYPVIQQHEEFYPEIYWPWPVDDPLIMTTNTGSPTDRLPQTHVATWILGHHHPARRRENEKLRLMFNIVVMTDY